MVAPPPMAERCLHEMEIIAQKAGISEQLLGAPLPPRKDGRSGGHTIGENEEIRRLLESWRNTTAQIDDPPSAPHVTYLLGSKRGAFGAWLVDGSPILLSLDSAGDMTDESSSVLRAAERVTQSRLLTTTENSGELSSILQAAIAWNDRRRAWTAVVGNNDRPQEQVHHDVRRSLARVADAAITGSTFARRFQSASVAARFRDAAASPLPLAVEWSLESLTECADEASVNTILDLIETARPVADRVREVEFRCIALIIFVPDTMSML